MKKILATILTTGALLVGIGAPAQASSGNFSLSEFFNLSTTMTQSNVATYCNCSGDDVGRYTSGGNNYKDMAYDNYYGYHHVVITFVWKNGSWYADSGVDHADQDYYWFKAV